MSSIKTVNYRILIINSDLSIYDGNCTISVMSYKIIFNQSNLNIGIFFYKKRIFSWNIGFIKAFDGSFFLLLLFGISKNSKKNLEILQILKNFKKISWTTKKSWTLLVSYGPYGYTIVYLNKLNITQMSVYNPTGIKVDQMSNLPIRKGFVQGIKLFNKIPRFYNFFLFF